MNWVDLLLLALIAFSAIRGFARGFVLELCGLAGLVLGIWGAIHLNGRVAEQLGLDVQHEAISFLLTLVLIVVALHLIGIALTKVIDLAQLSLPNKLGGLMMGCVRQVFVLSVLLNILFAVQGTGWLPAPKAMGEAALAAPIRSVAPAVLPALRGTKWVKRAIDELRQELEVEPDR